MRVLAAGVLVAEALMVIFATIVTVNLTEVPAGRAWAVGVIVSLACLALGGLLRYRWAYLVGSAVQVALLLSGFVLTAMFFLGALFGALWAVALWYGHKIDMIKVSRTAG